MEKENREKNNNNKKKKTIKTFNSLTPLDWRAFFIQINAYMRVIGLIYGLRSVPKASVRHFGLRLVAVAGAGKQPPNLS